MSKALASIASLFALLTLGASFYLIQSTEGAEGRGKLIGVLLGEGVVFSAVILIAARPLPQAPTTAAANNRNRERERIPTKPLVIPAPILRSAQVAPASSRVRLPRTPAPLESLPVHGPRLTALPSLPELTPPTSGRRKPESPEPTPTPQPQPRRRKLNISDLPEQAPLPPPPPPKPKRPSKKPQRPKGTRKIKSEASDLPEELTEKQLEACVGIVSLATYCATADNGAASSDEDNVIKSWMWAAIERVVGDGELAWKFHDELFATHEHCRQAGKQKLDKVRDTAAEIRKSLGRNKLVNAAAWLCFEVIKSDDKLDTGEAAIFQVALEGLGKDRSPEFADVTKELLLSDDDVKELLDELKISEDDPQEKRNEKLLKEWRKCNARMNNCSGDQKENLRKKMELITKVRNLMSEIEQHR